MKRLYNKTKSYINNLLNIFILVVVLVTIVLSILLVRQKLLQNTQELGMSLAKSYASEEELYISSFRDMLNLGVQYVDELYVSGDTEDIQSWLQDYFEKISTVLGSNVADPYAVIDGEIVAANPWEGDEDYEYENTMWYQQAMEADGEIIFTDVYRDAITGQLIVTLAQQLKKDGDVLVMDLYPDNFQEKNTRKELPAECSFYLCDAQGNMINAIVPWDISKEELESNMEYLLEGIRDGSLLSYDAYFKDYKGEKRGAYYHEMSNGWMVILTIPFDSVLFGEKNMVVYLLAGVGAFTFLTLFVMIVKNLIQMRKIRVSENTVRILGDSFYAIYLLDYKKGTYEFIKPSEDIAKEIPLRGAYEDLLAVIKKYVEKEAGKEFVHAFSLEQIRERVGEKIADYGGDYKRRFGDTYKWVNVRTLYNEKVAPDQVIFCFREVDLEKRQQQQHTVILQDALESARENAKMKETFFNNMSHDMRTPLNAIIGFSELVLKNEGNWEKVADYMDKILYAGRQLLNLINDILELSRIQSGKNAPSNEEFDIEQTIKRSAALFESLSVSQNKTLTVDIQVRDRAVYGDSFKLEQIMNNLLSNAFKYSNPGAYINVEVRQDVFMNKSRYRIVVSDTGIGMSEEFVRHIFEPYARETRFSTSTVVGTGLGMPIVKGIVQQLSGEVKAESKLGKGSRFTLVIPFMTVNKTVEEKKQNDTDKEKKEGLAGCRILLAEDNELNREIATEILQMNGVEVISAVNGEEAVHIFRSSEKFSIDAILMDMQMPVMDGCEAARAIRMLERDDAKTIPIIAVTANAFAEDIEKTSNAGMNGHISKPIDFKVLTETLTQMIGKR